MNKPTNFLQFKNTDICLDLNCDCGHDTHVDGYFARFIQCPWCKQVFELTASIEMKKVNSSDLAEGCTPPLMASKNMIIK